MYLLREIKTVVENTTLFSRRSMLLSTAAFSFVFASASSARSIKGAMPWVPDSAYPPTRVMPGGWTYFTPDEAKMVETFVDHLIPADGASPGGKDCGCAVFIDRQLTGPYGTSENLYMRGPFSKPTPYQGYQTNITPAARYRSSLKAISVYITTNFSGKKITDLSGSDIDVLLTGLESGKIELQNADSKAFFALLLKDTREGFFSDPIYGGNRDMASWRMIGFPGARYDLRDWVHRHNELYPLGPVSISGQ